MSPNPNNRKRANMVDISLDKAESDEDDVRDRRKNITKSHSFEERSVKTANSGPHQSLSQTAVPRTVPEKKQSVSSLVDELLCDIYGKSDLKRKGSSATNGGDWSWHDSDSRQRGNPRFRSNLKQMEMKCWSKDIKMIKEEIAALESLVVEESNNLVKYLKRKDYLLMRREAHYDVITAVIQAISSKTKKYTNRNNVSGTGYQTDKMSLFNSLRKLTSGSKNEGDDMKMKFSLAPGAETGFSQWLDAMKMVAQLPGGVPSEFRRKLWLQLSERHLTENNIDWEKAEAIIFNEWTNPDDEELGVQIVKDLHRTGCSLFCGAQEQNQALLKRVLLAYARWNKNVGYCQGFNMLAALILQVMDRDEKNSVKVMIYLIEGVLPESYFANNLRGLSVDMAVFRDLLRLRLPKLSKHLDALQNDTSSGTGYEPPLTNVFTMQWFLTLFSNCLPQQTVLRVWDLIFLHGNEILLRTALAIWGILQDRIISVESADEFYSIMGVVTREMLEFGLMDANNLVKMIVTIEPFPNELQELREKYLYNISPWTQTVQSAARKGIRLFYSDPEDQDDTEDEDKIALATAYGVFRKRDTGAREIQPTGPTLDISALKQQYVKLKQRQRQAHIIISAACSSNITANLTSVPTVSVNHLLLGKSALINKGRRIGPLEGSIPPPKSRSSKALERQVPKKEESSGETLEWKDAEKRKVTKKEKKKTSNAHGKETRNVIKNEYLEPCNGLGKSQENQLKRYLGEEEIHNERDIELEGKRRDSSGSSTSTELCDDENYSLTDIDLEETFAEGGKIDSAVGKIRYDDVKKCADELIREIEEKLQKSDRLKNQKILEENNNNYLKLQDLTASKHDNISEVTAFTVEEERKETKKEVPKSEIDSAENKTFGRSKLEDREEEPKRDRRDRRKSDLALSVIRENLEMLNKFSHKIREEGARKGDERTDLFGDHFRKGETEERDASPQVTTKVNKEVNTDITIATDSETSPKLNPEKSKGDDFLISLISGKTVHKSPERFKPERVGYREEGDRYGREDIAEKWKKESEKIESKIEMSKSDWDLKMKKIAELENTTREKLNEMRTKSMTYRHRSLDRFEGREKRKSPIPKIEVSEDETGDSEKRKKKISALSFDEITSRTEKLLGTNIGSETGSRKWRKSFDEEAPQYEFHSSPTSPEHRHRKYTEYFSPKRYETRWKYATSAAASEEDWLTISEENGKPERVELASHGRKPETIPRSPTSFNPFPTRTHSRPKELGVRLGMYPSSPKSPHTSKRS